MSRNNTPLRPRELHYYLSTNHPLPSAQRPILDTYLTQVGSQIELLNHEIQALHMLIEAKGLKCDGYTRRKRGVSESRVSYANFLPNYSGKSFTSQYHQQTNFHLILACLGWRLYVESADAGEMF